MKKPVATTPLADLQILAIDAWWRENRDKAPDLFEEELALAFRILESAPGAGRKYPHPSGSVRVCFCARRGITSTTWSETTAFSSSRSGAP